jgi:hypothetical protein
VDVDERSLVHRLFQLAGELAPHVRKRLATTRRYLLLYREIARRLIDSRPLTLHLTKHGLVTLEPLLGVFGSDRDRLKVREAATMVQKPSVDFRNEPGRQHRPEGLHPLVAARAWTRAHAVARPRLPQVPALAGQLEQQVERLTLVQRLGPFNLAALFQI